MRFILVFLQMVLAGAAAAQEPLPPRLRTSAVRSPDSGRAARAGPAGHILLDELEDSSHKVGFDPRDIKFLLITHAHMITPALWRIS